MQTPREVAGIGNSSLLQAIPTSLDIASAGKSTGSGDTRSLAQKVSDQVDTLIQKASGAGGVAYNASRQQTAEEQTATIQNYIDGCNANVSTNALGVAKIAFKRLAVLEDAGNVTNLAVPKDPLNSKFAFEDFVRNNLFTKHKDIPNLKDFSVSNSCAFPKGS